MAERCNGRRAPAWTGACVFGLSLLLGACTDTDEGSGPTDELREFPIVGPGSPVPVPPPDDAWCDIDVEGTIVDLEEVYLPGVVQCENGGANLEALKAQAIAARSVAYYAMATDGTICDSQGCQVYSCGNPPTATAIQAVEETSGMYLKYGDILTYGFYVAGDSGVSSPSCIGTPGAASTEHWITYNEGQSGTDVEQTELGFVHPVGDPGYGQNRGCMGQWSARCLENDNGYDYVEILQFFYGDDIEIVQAQGPCVGDVEPPPGDDDDDDAVGSSDGGVVDGDGGGSGTDAGGVDDGGLDAGDDGGLDAGDDDDDDDAADGGLDAGDDLPEDDGGDDGTGDGFAGGEGALPDTYGGSAIQTEGCACSTDRDRRATPLWLLGLLMVWRRRR